MRSDHRDPLNLGTEEVVSINELARIVIDLSGKRGLTLRHVPGPARRARPQLRQPALA